MSTAPPIDQGWRHQLFPACDRNGRQFGWIGVQVFTPNRYRAEAGEPACLLFSVGTRETMFVSPEAVTLGQSVVNGLADVGVLCDWVREHADEAVLRNRERDVWAGERFEEFFAEARA